MNSTDNSHPTPKNNGSPHEHRHNFLEILFTVISGILLAALLGYLGYRATFRESKPDLTISKGTAYSGREFQTLPVDVENHGDMAARNVDIRATVSGTDGSDIDAETTIDWVPGLSKKQGEVVFPKATDIANVKLTITGYGIP